jgi:hypothetical protein
MSWSSKWSLSFWLSHQYPICIPLLPHSCYMHRQSHHGSPTALNMVDQNKFLNNAKVLLIYDGKSNITFLPALTSLPCHQHNTLLHLLPTSLDWPARNSRLSECSQLKLFTFVQCIKMKLHHLISYEAIYLWAKLQTLELCHWSNITWYSYMFLC